MEKCAIIPEGLRQEVEQILFYLQNRNKRARSASSLSSTEYGSNTRVSSASSVRADMDQIDNYIELFYEETAEKSRGAMHILELTKTVANLEVLIENETLIGALARVFREDWKKNFELATTIIRIFIGALCMNAMDYEIKRSDLWAAEAKNADEKTSRKCRLAIRKQQALLAACIVLLTNLAHDINVELKMEQGDIIGKLLQLFPIGDVELRKVTIRLLFNLSFDAKSRRRMVSEGLVAHVAPLIESDPKALNLLYQLSVNDDAKAMLTFTDAMQLLMRDLLTGNGSEATKAVLLNACAEKRNAQLVCGHDGQGLALLMDAAIDGRDLMVAKIIRSIASHEGPTQDMFVEDENVALGLEFIGTAALIKVADWSSLSTSYDLVNWIGERLKASSGESEPLQLQMGIAWLWESARHKQGERGLAASGACLCCVATLAYCVSASHSIVLMSAMWISIFALCSLLSALYSMTITHKPMEKFSYGLARVPVLAVFSTTVLAQLFSIFLSKESFEHLLSPDHQGAHDTSAAHEHDLEAVGSWPYFVGAVATSVALLLSAYALKNQPFQHEHAADICHAICWVVPGLSRLLLPRINSMVLLAAVTSAMLVLCEHFRHDFAWADPVCCLLLSVAVFSTMWPLSTFTGMILLQTAPPHLLNQIDRCISEASTIDGVLEIRSRHFWQLDFGQLVGTVDVRVRRDADEQNVLTLVTDKMSSVVSMLTVQIVKDAAWHTVEGINPRHTYDSAHVHGDSHGHGHSHDHDEGNHGHSHDHSSGGHGHSHDYGDHGQAHDGHSHMGNPHGSNSDINQYNAAYGASGYGNPALYGLFEMNRVFFRAAHTPAARRALLERIIRVDHAGELGADRIYAGQMAVLQGSPVASVIKKMWDEEKGHLDVMERLAAKYDVPHTVFSPIFSAAAYALGVGTALLGKEGAMACTVAVEELIGQHYNNQLKELIADDPEAHKDLLDTLTKLRDDELHHHDT
ncbi:hypothetical protein GCK32_007807, partial [Trichostrongylus colubriformis]